MSCSGMVEPLKTSEPAKGLALDIPLGPILAGSCFSWRGNALELSRIGGGNATSEEFAVAGQLLTEHAAHGAVHVLTAGVQ
jgi:hypothetical protein